MIKNFTKKANKYFLVGMLAISVMGTTALAAVPGAANSTDSQIAFRAELDTKKAQPVKVKVVKKKTVKLALDTKEGQLIRGPEAAKIKIKPGLSNKQIEIKKKERKERRKQKRLEEQRQARLAAARVKAASTPVVKVDRRTNFTGLYKRASKRFGIPWQILAAVHSAETGQSGNTTIGSYAGARGPMQFMPGTWAAYGVDGDGDGVANIYDVDDAVHSAARYLAANGGGSNIRGALYHYNHATWYVNKVVGIAKGWGYRG